MKIIIVGGVAGGATAAARLRRLSEEHEIIMLERDEYISYANCGLPYYIGGVITDKQKLQVQTVKGMAQRFNLDIRVKSEVLAIDTTGKNVTIKNLENGTTYKERYDKLILSCGAKPIVPNIKGWNSEYVFTLRNIPDTYRIKDYIDNNAVQNAVVIGGGFIGVEMAENLRELGLNVTLVEKTNQVLRSLDFEMAQIVHGQLEMHGIKLVLGDGISAFEGKDVVLESGLVLPSDMTILAIGVSPENTLAVKAGFALGERGHVKVTENFNVYSDTGAEADIYAIGDMIEVINPLDDSSYAVPLAWGANRQGRLVADSIMGMKIKTSKILGANVLKVFDLTAASVGVNETTLKEKGMKYTSIHSHRANHATYYPNSSNLSLKLLFCPETGRLYGAQGVGKEGTEKRIDVLATVMRLGGTAYDLSDLELCYAPPYSSAKDPVNILGYIAENVLAKTYNVVHHDEIDALVAKGGVLLDVRTPFEFNNAHIEGAINIELDTLRDNIDKIPAKKTDPIYLTCQVGMRAYLAINILRAHGYKNLYNLTGGYTTYRNFKYALGKKAMKIIKKEEGDDMQYGKEERTAAKEIDVTGVQCPGPLMAVYKALSEMSEGGVLKVTATDSGFTKDIQSWCDTNGHTLIELKAEGGKYYATLKKGQKEESACLGSQTNATLVLFSGELDKALAAMIIAQGAAAQGKDVTIFFTFWGLNALRKEQNAPVKKTAMEKMFGMMMPKGAKKLPLSNMNMAGMGAKMIKGIMKKKNVDSLPVMIQKAMDAGVKMIACTMSMDLMGLKAEELLDGVEYAGVATYISRNENAGTTLFI